MMTTLHKHYKTEAIILRHYPLGEADLILTFYTPGHGKLRAVARGARRTRSKFVGHLEPLTRVLLNLTSQRTLDSIDGAQALDSHRRPRENLVLLSHSLYCAELIDAFTPEEQPSPGLYHLLRKALEWISVWDSPTLLVRYFEFRTLALSGYLPELYLCVACRKSIPPEGHAFNPLMGGVLCSDCYNTQGEMLFLSLAAIKVMRYFHREDPEAVASLILPGNVLREVEHALRSCTTSVLNREINAARFLYRLQQLNQNIEDSQLRTTTATLTSS